MCCTHTHVDRVSQDPEKRKDVMRDMLGTVRWRYIPGKRGRTGILGPDTCTLCIQNQRDTVHLGPEDGDHHSCNRLRLSVLIMLIIVAIAHISFWVAVTALWYALAIFALLSSAAAVL